MTLINQALKKDPRQWLMIESSRISLYLIILLVSLISYMFSSQFINWQVLAPFYAVLVIALSSHLVILSLLDKLFSHPGFLFATFVLDSFLISFLIYYSGTNQSLFLFLHMINILLAGLVFRSQGALIVALLTSCQFTFVSLLGPELKALNYFFLLALNNVAYFLIAGMAGYLSEQLFRADQELTQTGLSLKETQELNQFILTNIPSGLFSFDTEGQIYQSNSKIHSMLGLQAQQNVFEKWPELRQWMNVQQPVIKNEIRREVDGEEKTLGWTLTQTLNPLTQQPLWISLVEDLTQIKQLENSLRQSEKLAAVGGLAAGIAHEIRNPLAGISGSVELLSQTTANEDDRKLMKIILREIDRLNNLITEFLDYARPETPPTDVFDVGTVLREVMDSMKNNQKIRTDVKLDLQINPSLEVVGKKDKLRQAFLNIILNSYQAMQDVETAVLEISAWNDPQKEVTIKIKDSGMGMKPETVKRMFEPFHTTKSKGTGLGLAVTHKILENHQAKIAVSSFLGQGTEFTLVFPCPHASSSEK